MSGVGVMSDSPKRVTNSLPSCNRQHSAGKWGTAIADGGECSETQTRISTLVGSNWRVQSYTPFTITSVF